MDIKSILSKYPPEMDNLLNMLHELQDAHPKNYLPDDSLKEVAGYLNTTLSSVYGVVNYYTMFSTKPRARHIVRVCHSPVCHLMGAGTILEVLEKHLGVGLKEATPDGMFWIEHSECLGICDIAPAITIDNEPFGYLTEQEIVKILSEIRSGAKVPASGRASSR
jgi:NADH-quinone oxidoreductase subunit E